MSKDPKSTTEPQQAIAFDPQLILKLARPGPRYTSYPTVPVWTEAFDVARYAERLAAADAVDEPISLYVHLPFCRERCHYCGCNVLITGKQEKADRYLDYVEREMELVGQHLTKRRRVDQIHLGGGTPTFLDERQLQRLWRLISDRFTIEREAEIALEVDPRVTTREQLALLRGFGFNRLSLGVQDFTPEVQGRIGRIQSVEETAAMTEYARFLGYSGINYDLIYGLPLQRPDDFATTIARVLELRPDRVALFSYAHVPWLHPQQGRFEESELPDALKKIELYETARSRFVAAGYVTIGMDHFALPEDDLAVARVARRLKRNFQGYTARPPGATVAFGASAISDIADSYVQNVKGLADYFRRLDAGELPIERGWLLTEEDRLRRHVIHEIMCNAFVDLAEQCQSHGFDRDTFVGELAALAEVEQMGLLKRAGSTIEATPLGQVLVRNIAMTFDSYLPGQQSKPTFSQTV